MAPQNSDLNIRKSCNKQYILPNSPSEQDEMSQHPITTQIAQHKPPKKGKRLKNFYTRSLEHKSMKGIIYFPIHKNMTPTRTLKLT